MDKATLKKELAKMGISVTANSVKKSDVKKFLAKAKAEGVLININTGEYLEVNKDTLDLFSSLKIRLSSLFTFSTTPPADGKRVNKMEVTLSADSGTLTVVK